jgi:asparagine synthetase B (glutamine-hydrolysing)
VTVCLTGDGADEFFGGYGRSQRYDSQASDVWHELVCWHLPRLDRVMMRNRIEVRSPFLARRVAGMALALPRRLRTDKAVLRDLFRNDLPPGVADVPKRPLRMANVEADREGWSLQLIEEFRKRVERMNQEHTCPR